VAPRHIDEELLDRYVLETLAEDSLAEVEEHLLICTECQSRLVETDEFVTLFRAAAIHPDARPTPLWERISPFRGVIWAGPASAVAALFILLTGGEPRDSGPPAAVVLMEPLRGPAAGPQIAPGKSSRLVFDLPVPAVPASYRVEIVDLDGNRILEKEAEAEDGRITALVGRLPRGSYWVRLYRRTGENELVAEYPLQVR
jgi:putative zinc finger protein